MKKIVLICIPIVVMLVLTLIAVVDLTSPTSVPVLNLPEYTDTGNPGSDNENNKDNSGDNTSSGNGGYYIEEEPTRNDQFDKDAYYDAYFKDNNYTPDTGESSGGEASEETDSSEDITGEDTGDIEDAIDEGDDDVTEETDDGTESGDDDIDVPSEEEEAVDSMGVPLLLVDTVNTINSYGNNKNYIHKFVVQYKNGVLKEFKSSDGEYIVSRLTSESSKYSILTRTYGIRIVDAVKVNDTTFKLTISNNFLEQETLEFIKCGNDWKLNMDEDLIDIKLLAPSGVQVRLDGSVVKAEDGANNNSSADGELYIIKSVSDGSIHYIEYSNSLVTDGRVGIEVKANINSNDVIDVRYKLSMIDVDRLIPYINELWVEMRLAANLGNTDHMREYLYGYEFSADDLVSKLKESTDINYFIGFSQFDVMKHGPYAPGITDVESVQVGDNIYRLYLTAAFYGSVDIIEIPCEVEVYFDNNGQCKFVSGSDNVWLVPIM